MLPDALSAADALFLILASTFTSAMTAAFGVGGGIAMLVLLGLFLPVAALIPVHGVVQLGSNAGRAWRLRAHVIPGAMLPFALGGIFGAIAGGPFVVAFPDAVLKVALGLFVIALTWLKLPPVPASRSPAVFGLGGMVTTALSMFLGATGPLVAALMGRAFDERRQVVANSAVAMTAQHLLKVVVFGFLGFNLAPWVPLAIAMIASGYAGTVIGARILEIMDEDRFRYWFRIAITILAVEMLRRAFSTLF
jgi:uncharacterized protein